MDDQSNVAHVDIWGVYFTMTFLLFPLTYCTSEKPIVLQNKHLHFRFLLVNEIRYLIVKKNVQFSEFQLFFFRKHTKVSIFFFCPCPLIVIFLFLHQYSLFSSFPPLSSFIVHILIHLIIYLLVISENSRQCLAQINP